MDTFNHVPTNDYSSQNTIIIFKSCLELNFCQAGTSLVVDEGCNGFLFIYLLHSSTFWKGEEGHLSFWKGSLFHKAHKTVCLTGTWASNYLSRAIKSFILLLSSDVKENTPHTNTVYTGTKAWTHTHHLLWVHTRTVTSCVYRQKSEVRIFLFIKQILTNKTVCVYMCISHHTCNSQMLTNPPCA